MEWKKRRVPRVKEEMVAKRIMFGLALTGLVLLALAGAAAQLVRGERPVLLA